jgi:hypothetical protein
LVAAIVWRCLGLEGEAENAEGALVVAAVLEEEEEEEEEEEVTSDLLR